MLISLPCRILQQEAINIVLIALCIQGLGKQLQGAVTQDYCRSLISNLPNGIQSLKGLGSNLSLVQDTQSSSVCVPFLLIVFVLIECRIGKDKMCEINALINLLSDES